MLVNKAHSYPTVAVKLALLVPWPLVTVLLAKATDLAILKEGEPDGGSQSHDANSMRTVSNSVPHTPVDHSVV